MNLIKYLPRSLRDAHSAWKQARPLARRECPVCSYHGWFDTAGRPPRLDARCSDCGSLERHRLFWLWYLAQPDVIRSPVLHFAAEPVFIKRFRERFGNHGIAYRTADLYAQADVKLDIERIELPDASVQTVICNHVLEHVDDAKALAEIHRILRADGVAILSVPIEEGWAHTYENSTITSPADRELHFGQHDHVRFYGRDFRDRLAHAGFTVQKVTSEPADVATYSLLRGDTFFVCTKTISRLRPA